MWIGDTGGRVDCDCYFDDSQYRCNSTQKDFEHRRLRASSSGWLGLSSKETLPLHETNFSRKTTKETGDSQC